MIQNTPNYGKWVSISEIHPAHWLPTPHSPPFPLALVSYLNYCNSLPIYLLAFSLPTSTMLPPVEYDVIPPTQSPVRLEPNPSGWVRGLLSLALGTSLQPHFCFSPILLNVARPTYTRLFPTPTLTEHIHVSMPLLFQILSLECSFSFPHCMTLIIFGEPASSVKSPVKLR